MKSVDRIQTTRTRRPGRTTAGRAGAEKQLAAFGGVGGVPEEVKTEQRVVEEDAVRSAHDSLAIAFGIPRHAEARLNVVGIGLDALL